MGEGGDINGDIKQENLGAFCTQYNLLQVNKEDTYLVDDFLYMLLCYFTFFWKSVQKALEILLHQLPQFWET